MVIAILALRFNEVAGLIDNVHCQVSTDKKTETKETEMDFAIVT